MEYDQISSLDVLVFIASAFIVILLLFGFIIYFLVSYRQKRNDNLLLESQKAEIERQRTGLEKTLEDLKLTQAQLIQAEKMASLGDLVAGIAHEIQNPLNFVNNFAELNQELLGELKEEVAQNNTNNALEIIEDVDENLSRIREHGKRVEMIVKSMLEHSRPGKGVKEHVDINIFCTNCLNVAYEESIAKLKGFSAFCETDFDEQAGSIDVMKTDIMRVLFNLLSNAFYAVYQRSNNEINAESNYQPKVTIKTKRLAQGVQISIADNGTGIPKHVMEKIFQPFFTTKPAGVGTGLGLSLSNDIIKAHGGKIFVETEENLGSRFVIELPVRD
jgi:two-component system, NtrC family, sensor kinase